MLREEKCTGVCQRLAGVGVACNLTEVRPVSEHPADRGGVPASGDAFGQQVRKRGVYGTVCRGQLECARDVRRGARVVGCDAALAIRVPHDAPIADRARPQFDAALGYAQFDLGPAVFDAVKLKLGYRQEHRQHKTPIACGRIDVLGHEPNGALSRQDALNVELCANHAAGETVQLRADEAVQLVALDAFDYRLQLRPVLRPAAAVLLQNPILVGYLDIGIAVSGPTFYRLALLIGGHVAGALAAHDARDAHVGGVSFAVCGWHSLLRVLSSHQDSRVMCPYLPTNF